MFLRGVQLFYSHVKTSFKIGEWYAINHLSNPINAENIAGGFESVLA